ncbi:hypothetical protein ACFVZH_08275 [Streptomyces sp. NPDC059534]|uniref:hypothetical protein n=1 Tax=Streptomyces sp. NPDC059534 TaxID=3346859 RepID=UPI0036A2C618
MAKEVISRCDECGSTEGVEEFTIIRDGVPKDVDLCAPHAAPVIRAYDLGATSTSVAKKATKGRRGGHAVIAIEDWEPDA